MQALPDLTQAVRCEVIADGSREALTAAWKAWMEEASEYFETRCTSPSLPVFTCVRALSLASLMPNCTPHNSKLHPSQSSRNTPCNPPSSSAVGEAGAVPPGNAPGETKWQAKPAARPKTEVRLTAGKAVNVPIEALIDGVVKENRVVAFVKGTRAQPQCGFSYKLLTLLNDCKADYEVVNVLDEFHNPGLREAIKAYSQWPTIPQLYVGGEFVGGADIVEQMAGTGELQLMLRGEK